jgi:glycosyltransferase involved in cell wall biosynthesis
MKPTIVHYVDSAAFGGNEQALLHLLQYTDRDRWQLVLFHQAESGIAPLLEGAHRLKVRTQVVPRLRGLETISGLPLFLHHLRKEKPTIFHAHLNWLLSCKYGLAMAALARVPFVIATLQQFLLSPWGLGISIQQRVISTFVDQYIAVSFAVAQQLSKDFRVSTTKIKVIHNSIPVSQYNKPENPKLRSELNQGTGWPIILTVARLDDQKGHTYLLEAMANIPEAIVVLVGDGPTRTTLEAQAEQLGISARVRFLGYRTDIPDLLASSDFFVLPSIYEGFPLSILEAMAAGKAVVATAVGGTPEAVLDGETGYLVPPGDSAALAHAIRRVLVDTELAHEMGVAGGRRVQERFPITNMVQCVTNVYEELVNKRGVYK